MDSQENTSIESTYSKKRRYHSQLVSFFDTFQTSETPRTHRYLLRSRTLLKKSIIERRLSRASFPYLFETIETENKDIRRLDSRTVAPIPFTFESDYEPEPPRKRKKNRQSRSPSPRAVALDIPDPPSPHLRELFGLVPLTPPPLLLRVDRHRGQEQHLCFSRASSDPPCPGYDLPIHENRKILRRQSTPPKSLPLVRPCLPRKQ